AATIDSPSRRKIFMCRPASRGDSAAEESCARRILSTLARRAFRRPVTDAEVQTLVAFFKTGRDEAGFESGIQRGLQRILAAPSFLFRIEGDGSRKADGPAPVPLLDLASRLSFFLWSSIPDD